MRGQSSDQGVFQRGFRPIITGVISGMLLSAALLLAFSVFLSIRDVPQSMIDPMAIFAISVGGLLAGFLCVRMTRSGGLLYGACCGAIYALIIIVAGLLSGAGGIGIPAAFRVVFIMLCAMIGGVLGVNVRQRRR